MSKPRLALKKMRSLKKSLLQNGIKGVVPSGQDPTQLHSQLVKGKFMQRRKATSKVYANVIQGGTRLHTKTENLAAPIPAALTIEL